jgi:hypothetical protein
VMANSTVNVDGTNAIGLNSVNGATTSGSSIFSPCLVSQPNAGTSAAIGSGQAASMPAIGYSFAQVVEQSTATGTTTWRGTSFSTLLNSAATDFISGRW